MTRLDSVINISIEQDIEKTVNEFAERLDFLDVQLLRKFYVTNSPFPYDTQPYCFPLLYKEMRDVHKIKIGSEALRKRLDNLVKIGLLEKIRNSNPANYSPVRGRENFVRATVMKFFMLSGLQKYL
ncbi:MAG: hypothetical protein J4452_03020 [Candidatus Aenigmarchaeota archaeon]|nr:hypothetical protein [Candidatus Aenigmarchaeota archaeon]